MLTLELLMEEPSTRVNEPDNDDTGVLEPLEPRGSANFVMIEMPGPRQELLPKPDAAQPFSVKP